MRRLTLAAGILAALLASGCSSISAGTVVGKAFEPSYTYYVPTCMSYGKYGCTVSIPVPETQPDCYRLDLRHGDDTGSVCVDRVTFDRYRSGQVYP